MADSPKLREPEEPINRTFVLLAQTNKQDFRSTGSSPIELVRFRQSVSAETPSGTRRYPSISLPNGMFAACDHQVPAPRRSTREARSSPRRVRPIGTSLRLVFEAPRGVIQVGGTVRGFSRGEGMSMEFTRMRPRD